MAAVALNDPQARNSFWQRCVMANLHYWKKYLARHTPDTHALEGEWEGVIKAILFGLELKQAWPEVYQLITDFSSFMERRGHWNTWQIVLDQALIAARQACDKSREVTLLALNARLGQRQGHFKQMVASYRRAIRLARCLNDIFNEGRACTNLGYFYIEHGYWTRAEVLCHHALRLFEQINNTHGLAHTENHLGLLYIRQCYWKEAQQHLEKACALWQARGDEHGLMYGFMNLGLLYLEMERLDQALEYTHKALAQAKSTGEEVEVGRLYLNFGSTYKKLGEPAIAEAYAHQAAEIFQNHASMLDLGIAWKIVGEACLYQEKWQEAHLYLNRALEIVRQHHNLYRELEVLLYLVEYDLMRGNQPQAVARLVQVERLMKSPEGIKRYCSLEPLLLKCRRRLASTSSS